MPSYLAVFEDTARIFDYVGAWRSGSLTDDALGNQYSQSSFTLTNTKGSTFSFSFYGTEVSIFGARRGNHGRYQVSMDGVASQEASGQAEPGRFNETLFTRTTTLGWHNVTMINLEDLYLDIDSVSWLAKVGTDDEALTTQRKEDTDSSFVWTPNDAWSSNPPQLTSFSQSSGHSTSTPGATAQLTFEGLWDAIALYGPVGPRGAAQYSITVGCRPPSFHSAWNTYNIPQSQLLYYGANFGGGRHTLTLKLESITDAAQILAVDYADIYTAPSIQSSQSSGDATCRTSSDGSPEHDTPIGLIVGVAVAGFIALLAIALLGYLYYLYRKNRLNFAGRRAPSPAPHMAPAHPAGGGYHATPFVPSSAAQYPNYPAQTPTTMGMSVPAMGYYNSNDSYHRATSPEATSSSGPSQSGVFTRPRSIHKGQRPGDDRTRVEAGTASVVPPPTYTMQ